MTERDQDVLDKKFRREIFLGKFLLNPTLRFLHRLRIRIPFTGEIETVGRKSGLVRRVPLNFRIDDTGAWLTAQHGYHAGWVQNLIANPNVRILAQGRWRTAVAELRPEIDPHEISRQVVPGRRGADIGAKLFEATATRPLTVRITFSDVKSAG